MYEDFDSDGYGNPNSIIQNCMLMSGYVENDEDCNDTNYLINPLIIDITGNNIDENCDGVDGNLSLNNESQLYNINLSPNPADNLIQLSGNLAGDFQIRILDNRGQVVLDRIVMIKGWIEININDILPGSYIVEIYQTDSRVHKFSKLLIIR